MDDISVSIDMSKLKVGDILEDMTEEQKELLVDLVDGAKRQHIDISDIPMFAIDEIVKNDKEDIYLLMSPIKQAVLIWIIKQELLRMEDKNNE